MASLWCVLLRKRLHLKKWWIDPIMLSKIRVRMSTKIMILICFNSKFMVTCIYLLQFKIQGHLQKRELYILVYQNSFRRQRSKVCTISVAIFFLSHKDVLTNFCNHQTLFKIVHFDLNNAKSRVRQYQACNLHTTHLVGPKLASSWVSWLFTAWCCFIQEEN